MRPPDAAELTSTPEQVSFVTIWHRTPSALPAMAMTALFLHKAIAAWRARACHQLSQTTQATSRTAARKFRAVFSYRVAIARNCLILAKKFSIRWRAP
jgi:hypothetical protein